MFTLLLNPNMFETTGLFVFRKRSAMCLLVIIENAWQE